MWKQEIHILEETQKSIQDVIWDVNVQHFQTKSVFTFQAPESVVSTAVENAKPAVKCSLFLLQNKSLQKPNLMKMVHIVMLETSRD